MRPAGNRNPEPNGPDRPPAKTLRVLDQQFNELQNFRNRNYSESIFHGNGRGPRENPIVKICNRPTSIRPSIRHTLSTS
jgi:hypothetical protein